MRLFNRRHISLALTLLLVSSSAISQKLWYPSSTKETALWEQIRQGKPTNVLHIGDSHINRGYTTAPITATLHRHYGHSISVDYWGINGATYETFTSDKYIASIVAKAPDLLIVSLGTNDSYAQRFSAERMRSSMNAFISKITKDLPNLTIVLTTPPACYLRASRSIVTGRRRVKVRGKHRKSYTKMVPTYRTTTSYLFNRNTATAVATIKYFARAMGYALIDLNAIIGTEDDAEEWLENGWMHTDHVHYTEDGYARHGEAIAKALIEAIGKKSEVKK